jgi:hypothetical protein
VLHSVTPSYQNNGSPDVDSPKKKRFIHDEMAYGSITSQRKDAEYALHRIPDTIAVMAEHPSQRNQSVLLGNENCPARLAEGTHDHSVPSPRNSVCHSTRSDNSQRSLRGRRQRLYGGDE